MRLFTYKMPRDFGFAPNPFHGFCTLGCCKPQIRKTARIGDWLAGFSSAKNGAKSELIYAMEITEVLSFSQYFEDARFEPKKPNLFLSKKYAYGDNIYHQNDEGDWIQTDSHHSYPNGIPNMNNVNHDTSINKVLVSTNFLYFGKNHIALPECLQEIIPRSRSHRCKFPQEKVDLFINYINSLPTRGIHGSPKHW